MLMYEPAIVGTTMNSETLYPCPCCGYLTLNQKPPGTYLICPICFWEDSTTDEYDPLSWNSNKVSLPQAQRNFIAFGACESEWVHDVRKPNPNDQRPSGWQTLDTIAEAAKLKLIKQIVSAFDRVTRDDGISLHEAVVIDSYGSDEQRAIARQKDNELRWQDVPDRSIEHSYSALCFLDPKGWRYYIPAYMIWSLKNYMTSGSNSIDSTVYTFKFSGDPEDYYLSRFKILNQEQSIAVCQFLLFMCTHHEGFVNDSWSQEALKNYWGKFCNSTS
jgi:hypothetical protein